MTREGKLSREARTAVRQHPHVPHDLPLGTEHRADSGAGVIGPKIHRHRPFHDRADAPPQLPFSHFWL